MHHWTLNGVFLKNFGNRILLVNFVSSSPDTIFEFKCIIFVLFVLIYVSLGSQGCVFSQDFIGRWSSGLWFISYSFYPLFISMTNNKICSGNNLWLTFKRNLDDEFINNKYSDRFYIPTIPTIFLGNQTVQMNRAWLYIKEFFKILYSRKTPSTFLCFDLSDRSPSRLLWKHFSFWPAHNLWSLSPWHLLRPFGSNRTVVFPIYRRCCKPLTMGEDLWIQMWMNSW